MPDEELKQLLKKNIEVSEESLGILKKMRRAALMGRFFSFLKWVIIIGISVGAYYYIEPYLQTMIKAFSVVSSGMDEVQKTGSTLKNGVLNSESISSDLLKKLQDLFPPR